MSRRLLPKPLMAYAPTSSSPSPMQGPKMKSHTPQPPAMNAPASRTFSSVGSGQPELRAFLEVMEGPAVTITVGTAGSQAHYTLPVKLLSAHSSFFATEIQRLTSAAASKKRKVAPDSDVKTTATVDVENHPDHAAPLDLAISVPDIEPAIFGLFLTYMYTGCYPSTVDIIGTPWAPAILTCTNKSPYPETTPSSAPPDVVPASICAWLLAHRLGAPSFMNHAMLRIYKGLSFYFVLTPSLTEYIWSNTTASVPSIAGQTSAEAPHLAASDRNPLRKFILDILTTYWSVPSTTSVIAKTGLGVAWTRVFDAHPDLRQHFILGMQGDKRVAQVVGYFVATPPTVGIVGGNEVVIKQESLDMNRTTKEKGMDVATEKLDVASEKLSVAHRTTPPKTD